MNRPQLSVFALSLVGLVTALGTLPALGCTPYADPSSFSNPAPLLTAVTIIGVRSAIHPAWEAISDGQLRTADHHGGGWLEIRTEDLGQGRDRDCRVNQERGRQVDEKPTISNGLIVGYKHTWRFDPFVEGRATYDARSSIGLGHHSATLQVARNNPPAPPQLPTERTQLRVTLFPWIPDAGRDYFEGYLKRIETEFEEANPTIDLLLQPMDVAKDLYSESVVSAVLAECDVVEVDMVILDRLLGAKLIEAWTNPLAGEFHPAATLACQKDSVVLAIPHWLCGHFVFTRNEQIAAATTAQEFTAALDAAHDGNIDLVADFTGGWNLPALYLDAWADSKGAADLSLAVIGEFDTHVAEVVETIADHGVWNGRNPNLNGAFHSNDRAASLFSAGVADALIGYSERLHLVTQLDCIGRPLLVSSAPLGAGSHPTLFVDGFVLRRGADASVQEAAARFALYMNDPTTLEWMLLSKDAPTDSTPRYLLPADLRVYEREALKSDPYYPLFRELTRAGRPFPSAGLSHNRKRIRSKMEKTFNED